MTKKNNLDNALIFGGLGLAGFFAYKYFNDSQRIVVGGSGAGGVQFIEGEVLTGVSDAQVSPSDADLRVQRTIETFNLQQAQDGFRIIQGDAGTQIIVSSRDRELVDEVARSSSRQGSFTGQATITDESGKAEIVRDFDRLESRSADGGFSQIGGGVGFAEPPNFSPQSSEPSSRFERFRNSFNWRGRF